MSWMKEMLFWYKITNLSRFCMKLMCMRFLCPCLLKLSIKGVFFLVISHATTIWSRMLQMPGKLNPNQILAKQYSKYSNIDAVFSQLVYKLNVSLFASQSWQYGNKEMKSCHTFMITNASFLYCFASNKTSFEDGQMGQFDWTMMLRESQFGEHTFTSKKKTLLINIFDEHYYG